jgi:hypothetical protein
VQATAILSTYSKLMNVDMTFHDQVYPKKGEERGTEREGRREGEGWRFFFFLIPQDEIYWMIIKAAI